MAASAVHFFRGSAHSLFSPQPAASPHCR